MVLKKNVRLTFILGFLLFIFFSFSCSHKQELDRKSEERYSIKALAYNNMSVSGELYMRAMRNFDRLEEERYRPGKVFLTEEQSNGWSGDTEGRAILGLTLAAQATHRTPLYLDTIIKRLASHLNAEGYMGPIYKNRINEQQLSGNGWMLRGLCEYYEWKKDNQVLEYIKSIAKLFVNNKGGYAQYPIKEAVRNTTIGAESGSIQLEEGQWMLSSDIGCVFIGMDGLVHAYKYLRDPEIKEVIEEMISRFLEIDLVKIKAQTHATLTACRALIRYAEITGDFSYIKEVQKRWEIYKKDGMTEERANYNWFDRFDTWTEPCAIVDSYMLAVQLWQYTRNFAYRNDAELIYYNALAHAQRANGGFGCENCPGEAINDPCLKVHVDEAYWCCTMRGAEGLSSAIRYSVFTDGQKRIYFPFYNSGEFKVPLSKGKSLSILEQTRYPFAGNVKFIVTDNTAGAVSLMFPIPFWMKDAKVVLNGNDIINEKVTDNFLELTADLKRGDIIEISSSLLLHVEKPINIKNTKHSDIEIYSGPLLLAAGNGNDIIEIKNKKELIPIDLGRFKLKNSDIIISPIYHFLDPIVQKTGYCRQILF